MKTLFFPLFSDFSEALVASLASRSHEWSYWEIVEIREYNPLPKVADLADANIPYKLGVEISLKSPTGQGAFEKLSIAPLTSPSKTMDQLFDTLHTSPLTQGTSEPFHRLHAIGAPVSESLIGHEELQKQISQTNTQAALWIRAKNSLGEYRECWVPKN